MHAQDTTQEQTFNFLGAQIQEGTFYTPNIQLPNQKSGLETYFAVDIGGSLVKIVYFQVDLDSKEGENVQQGSLRFQKFETAKMEDVINFIRNKLIKQKQIISKINQKDDSKNQVNFNQQQKQKVKVTGGGAFKYGELLQQELDIEIEKEDEMECLVTGCNFFLNAITDEAYTFDKDSNIVYLRSQDQVGSYPYLLVNIGSGVSMIKVESDGKFQRVNGSTLGGGTFLGLAKLLTKIDSFDEILELSEKGDYRKVDLLVGDIYGGRNYSSIGLNSDVVASAFGKIIAQNGSKNYKMEDIALSLSRMISFNIGQLAYLTATLHNIKKIYFGGFFIRGMKSTSYYIKFAVEYFSKNCMTATFLRHDGYLGSMGAFLKISQNPIYGKSRAQFQENYSSRALSNLGKSLHDDELQLQVDEISQQEKERRKQQLFISADNTSIRNLFNINIQKQQADLQTSPSQRLDLEVGELIIQPSFATFTLLTDTKNYEPNTFDYLLDYEERQWWQFFLESQLQKVIDKAIKVDGGTEGAIRRADLYKQAFIIHLRKWKDSAFGKQGLPEILAFQEQSLHEFGFYDIYKGDKEHENELALKNLPHTLQYIDNTKDKSQRLLSLLQGILASNVFDWGSEAYQKLSEVKSFDQIHQESRSNLSKRPWRVDDFQVFHDHFYNQQGQIKYNKIMIFTDNAGADLILGIVPLVREILRLKSDVVLVANARPAYNDITLPELQSVLHQISQLCPIIRGALLQANYQKSESSIQINELQNEQVKSPKLEVISSGLATPCLDLRRVNRQLAIEAAKGTNLIILDGMGRSIHTNYHTTFRCDVLKLAMVKQDRLAKRYFDGSIYDCICRFDQASEQTVQ